MRRIGILGITLLVMLPACSAQEPSLEDQLHGPAKATPPTLTLGQDESKALELASAVTLDKESGWRQWRGPNRDGKSPEVGLLKSWPDSGPKLLWKTNTLGAGYSSLAVTEGKVFTMGELKDKCFLICLDLKTGEKVWQTQVGGDFDNGWGGGPRGTPTVAGDQVFALSATGDLLAAKTSDGSKLWTKSLVKDFGGGVPHWGYSESPLVDGEKVVVTPGNAQCVVALDRNTGKVIWKSSGLSDPAQYSSIVVGQFADKKIYATMTGMGLVGIDGETGRFLFRYEKTRNGTAVIPTPVFLDGFIYSTSGYDTGCALVKLIATSGGVSAKEVYFNKTMVNQHGGVIAYDGFVYGYSDRGGWVCQQIDNGKSIWNERRKLPKGSISFADGMLYCFSENDGDLVLIDASTEGWKEKGRIKLPEQSKLPRQSGKVWSHPVIAYGKLFLRDLDLLFCFDVKDGGI